MYKRQDGNTGNSIVGANVVVLNTTIPNSSSTNLGGDYSSGNADSGTFDVVFSMIGYISDTLQATLINGQVVILDAVLYVDSNMPILGCMDPLASNYNPNANISSEYGGEPDNTSGTGNFFNFDQHLIFDASTDLLIKSAVIYAEDPKIVTFELRSSNGAVIDDTTHTVTQGQQQLVLNFEVPQGTGMELGISNGNSGLYRNDDGAVYPYNIGSVMSITGNSAGEPGYYYFYYNIEVEALCENISTNVVDLSLIHI